jgi:predicted dehydrogenase
MAAKSIGWGMIGTRGWSDMILGPAVQAARGARLCAVLSSKRASAARYCERHGVARGYTDIDKFLADPDLDVVWVASPNHLHKDQTIAALKAGKHVLCEKPMALSAVECRAMIRAAKKADRLLSIGYNSRHHPKLKALQADWVAGRFGEPLHAHGQFYYRYPDVPKNWWRLSDKKSGSWILGDIGTHMIDLLRWYLGEAKTVQGHLTNKTHGRSADYAFVTIGHKNGAVGTLSASVAVTAGGGLEFLGTNGYCRIEGGFVGLPGTMTTIKGNGKPRTVTLAPYDTYKAQVENMTKAITKGESLAVSAEDGLANVRIIEQARGW